jgi:hypothetical protein
MDDQTAFALYTLPAGQDVVRPAGQRAIDGVLDELREWMYGRGYTPLGPALLAWDEWARRQVRQPIVPVFAPAASPAYRLFERPELLVAAIPIALRDGKYNLAGVYDTIQAQGFDPLGAPYVPLLSGERADPAAVRGFVPVVPRGTGSLVPRPGWFTSKMGWSPPRPRIGARLARRQIVVQIGLGMLRAWIGLLLLAIVVLPLLGGLAWLAGAFARDAIIPWTIAGLLWWGGAGAAGVGLAGLIQARIRLRAAGRWNAFWRATPPPPLLIFDFQMED